jgi:hypothetical protein
VSKIRLAEVRYYIDADVLGLAHVLTKLRSDVTYPGDPGGIVYKRQRGPCPVTTPAAKDLEWIPVIAQLGWLIITRDGNIQAHRSEIAAVRDHGARMIALNTEHARTAFEQLEIVMCRWRQIEALHGTPGPFIHIATRSSLRQLPLT